MLFSAKRGIEIAYVVRPSVCQSVCDVGGSGSHRLEILETNCTVHGQLAQHLHSSSSSPKGHPPILRGTWGNWWRLVCYTKTCTDLTSTFIRPYLLFWPCVLSTAYLTEMNEWMNDLGGVHGINGVLEHKSGNISETRKDRWKVTMEGL